VDPKAYFYIYNEIFVEEWRQYIEQKKADPVFLKSKLWMEKSESENDVAFDSLSLSEKLEAAESSKKFIEFRQSKKGTQFQRLVEEFDRVRNIIACYNSKFYTYAIQNSFLDFIAVYMLERNDITNMLNSLYLTLNKQTRILIRENLFRDFEQIDEIKESEY
jgi:molecular chaperone GrpE (heat shock protein)